MQTEPCECKEATPQAKTPKPLLSLQSYAEEQRGYKDGSTCKAWGRIQKQKLREEAVAMGREGDTSLRALGLTFTGKAEATGSNWGVDATFFITDPCDAS